MEWSGLTWGRTTSCAETVAVARRIEAAQICSDERNDVLSIREVYSGGVVGSQRWELAKGVGRSSLR